jgi:hypothetical protein
VSKKLLGCMLVLAASSLMAQTYSSPNSSSNSSSPNPQQRMGRQGGQEPCFEVAGIQKSAMEQVWSLERETHSQIESVCSNSSLSPQEKHEQVHQLREQTHQKIESLITPEQDKALESCRQERGMEHQGMRGEGGGCGEGQRQGQGGWRGSQNGGGSPNSQNNSQNNGNRWNNNSQSSNSSPQN